MGDIKGPAPESNSTRGFASGGPVSAVEQTFALGEGPIAMGGCIGGYIDPEIVKAPSMARAAALTAENGLDPKHVAMIEDMLSDGRLIVQQDQWDTTGTQRLYAPVPPRPMMGRVELAHTQAKPWLGLKPEDFQVPADTAGIGDPITPQLGQIVVEVDLGPDDVLVLAYDSLLSHDARERYKAMVDAVLAQSGRQCLVLDGGVMPMVLHRTAPVEGSKPRKDRPYLEDMASPHGKDGSDPPLRSIPEQVSRGTSEGSEP